MRKAYMAIAIAALIGGAAPLHALAQSATEINATLDNLFGEHDPYRKFFDQLKAAVAADDRQAVAAMVDYPFQARIDRKAVKIRDAAHFVASFDNVVTARVMQVLAQQTYSTLFANWQGVSIGDGEIWFSRVGEGNKIKITAIND